MRRWFSSLISLFVLLVGVGFGHAYPLDGLVLHLSFDDETIVGDEVRDTSPEGNNGIINGDAVTAPGIFGEALEFDGVDDFVEIPLQPSITFSEGSSFSVQAWVKTDDEPQQNDGILGNYRDSTQALWMMSISGDDAAKRGKMGFSVRDVGKVHSAGVTSPDFLNDNEWHHLAGVRDQDAKKVRFYVDGALIDEVDDATENINSGQSVWIGEHLNRYFRGYIDEVKIWSRALSANELDQSRSGTAAVDPGQKLPILWGQLRQ